VEARVSWDVATLEDRTHALLSTRSMRAALLILSIHTVPKPSSGGGGYRGDMALLADADILRYRAKGEIRIEPFDERNLTPNGYDLSVAEVLTPGNDARTTTGVASVPPLARFAVSTREVVALGRHVAAEIWLRTTWARRGVIASFGIVDAGFSGSLTFGALNASDAPLEIPIGERFAQLVFLPLESPASDTYERRSGTYQGQRGVTLGRP